ncbi:polysialyltransferase family glycosyltransferase [uncultured Pontibacter sp.]|uniref:polysialyltransferase family glycosyltransferase n=1 Tax=uncultured Pontibacter sp. TaxID=453356 RepID=UPI002616605C|nr:polysialyltransferase family glycosyltransferase [uncultured Pontibacter sp.]
MKHLFYIHSTVTYFVALEVIKYKKLDKHACCLLLGRGFKQLYKFSEIKQSIVPFSHHLFDSFAVEKQLWNGWRKLRAFDDYVAQITNSDSFHLYTNQSGTSFIQLFISHRKCSGFSFLEEGMASFYPISKINNEICPAGYATSFYKLLKHLNYFGRLSQNPYFYDEGYDKVYGISEAAFPEFRNKIILDNPFYNSEASNCINGHLIALDALYEYGIVEKAVYVQAIEKMFLYFQKRKVDQIYIKYHPEQYNNATHLQEIRNVVTRYKRGIKVIELSSTCSLELIAGNNLADINFYVFLSSVGLYAGMCGKKANSFATYIGEKDIQFKEKIESLPSVFSKYVKFL